ncbi:hypothetical protein MMC30_004640 [Trapelia coarctata]|nr:hypothetical protein [Trapelia coarctata]
MPFARVVSYALKKGGLFGTDETHIDDLNPAPSKTPGKALGEGVVRKDFADSNLVAGSLFSGGPLIGGNNATNQIKGPGDADTGISDDHQIERTTTSLFGRNQASMETVPTKDRVPVPLSGIFSRPFASIQADAQLMDIAPQDPITMHHAAAAALTIAETDAIDDTGNQSGLEDEPAPGEGTEPGKGPGKGRESGDGPGDVPRDSPPAGGKAGPSIWLVREARRVSARFKRPYTLRAFRANVERLYPINSLMPIDENHLSFQVAIMFRNDRLTYDKNPEPKILQNYQLLRIIRDDETEASFTKFVLPRLQQFEAHPDPEFRHLKVVRIFDRLNLQDGRNTDRRTTMDLSFLETMDNGRIVKHYGQIRLGNHWLQDQFRRAIRRLIGDDATAAMVKMHRFPEDALPWRDDLDSFEFLTKFFWKIDHPIINVYPVDWRPTLTFEEAENLRERAARDDLAAEVRRTQAGGTQVLVPASQVEVPATQIPGTQAPGTRPQVSQSSANTRQGGGANPQRTAEGNILHRLDNVERSLQQLITEGNAADRNAKAVHGHTQQILRLMDEFVRKATVMPNFKCPYPPVSCGVEIAADPRDTYEVRVNRHLHTHINGGGRPCPQDPLCHARLDLMDAGQRLTHINMHNNLRQPSQVPGPGPVIAPLLPAANIPPQEPPRRSPSPEISGSEESDAAGAPRKGAFYCGVCLKYINNLNANSKRAHLDECKTKKRYMKAKKEVEAERKADSSKTSSNKAGKKRKVEDDDGEGDGSNSNDEENAPADDGEGDEAAGTRTTRKNSQAPRRPAAKKARGDGAAKTMTKKRKGGEEEEDEEVGNEDEGDDNDTDILGT